MRYLASLILLLSMSGVALAGDTPQQLPQLPPGAETVQIMGKTYWHSGDNFYQFNEQTGLFYQVPQPAVQAHRDQAAHMSQRSQTVPATNLTGDQIEGCRNAAADKSNSVPNRGSQVYIQEYNRCITDLQQ